ncbi:MAG TPA: MFS transporter [Chloroflexota bacterium]|nr:MFS transporter [Chloroflexota bacterium]
MLIRMRSPGPPMPVEADEPEYARRWLVFATVGIGSLMSTIDNSVVNLALPSLRDVFHVDLGTVVWVILTYLLVSTSLVLTMGRLADFVGRTRLYNLGFVVFTAGSLLCGTAPNIITLILFRALQGAGSAMINSSSTAVLLDVFPLRQRGQILGLQSATFASGNLIGPSVGGFLLTFFGWRSIFLVNIPIGIVGMIFAFKFLPKQQGQRGVRFDVPGSVLVGITIVCLLTALNQGQEQGWQPLVMALTGLFLTFGVAFLVREARAPVPLLRFGLFRVPGFTPSLTAQTLSTLAYSSNLFLLPFFLVSLQGRTEAQAGLILVASSVTSAIMSPIGGWLADRFETRYVASLGLAIMMFGFWLYSGAREDWSAAQIVVRLVVMSIGSGLFNSPNASAAFRYVPAVERGLAVGTMSFIRNLGFTTGAAFAAAIWTMRREAAAQALNLTPDSVPASVAGLRDTWLVIGALLTIALVASALRPKAQPAAAAATWEPVPVEAP